MDSATFSDLARGVGGRKSLPADRDLPVFALADRASLSLRSVELLLDLLSFRSELPRLPLEVGGVVAGETIRNRGDDRLHLLATLLIILQDADAGGWSGSTIFSREHPVHALVVWLVTSTPWPWRASGR